MESTRLSCITLLFIWLGWIANAHALTLLFTDQSAWQDEISGSGLDPTVIDFESTASQSSDTVTAADVTFSSPGIPLEVRDFGVPYGSGMALYPAFNQPLQIDLPGAVFAFGFDLGDLGGLEPPLYSPPTLSDVVLSTGEIFAGPFEGNPFPTFAFFGFLSDQAITSLSMWPRGSLEAIIDNFTYAKASSDPLPEPSTLLLLGSGIVIVAARKWRDRRG